MKLAEAIKVVAEATTEETSNFIVKSGTEGARDLVGAWKAITLVIEACKLIMKKGDSN